jgi:hypothetical protein
VTAEPFRTPVDRTWERGARVTLPSGKRVTSLPLFDTRHPELAARLDRASAVTALAAIGLQLPTLATVLEIARVGFWVAPVTLVHDAEDQRLMRTEAYCRRHDAEMFARLAAAGWDGTTVCSTFGKWHIAGAAPGNNRISGWPRARDGALIQQGTRDVHLGEELTDYATLTMGEEAQRNTDDEETPVPDTDRAPAAAPQPVRRTIRRGSTGGDVAAWQAIVGVTVDGRFGPGTEQATRLWQDGHRLVADGVVGRRSWEAAAEAWAPLEPSSGGEAPAARAALRDATAAWPTRRRTSDGIMGDSRHQATGKPAGHNVGNAVDISHDPGAGCDAGRLSLEAMGDVRVQYVIWDRHIWNRDRAREGWRAYSGANPHTHHVHIEIRPACRDDTGPWPWAPG